MKLKFFVITLFLLSTYYVLHTTYALAVTESDCLNKSVSELSPDDMTECINTILPRIAAAYAPAQEKNKQNLAGLKKQIDSLNSRINSISLELKKKESEIKNREKDVDFAQSILNEKAVSQYITARLYDPLISLISAKDALEAFKTIKIKEMVAEGDRKTIEKYSEEIINLKNDKESLEKNKISLASLQEKVSEDAKFLEIEVGKVETFLSALSAKQQEIINAKSGSFITSVGDTELADDYKASIKGFRESAPSGSFAAFSFGGYTHRKGMSQYGARGRAENGKGYNDILHAYYNFDGYEDRSGITIRVNNGNGVNKGSVIWTGSLEEYAKRIYEVPGSWPNASLEAQAIAARSYALAVTNNGAGTICANQYCQVFKTQPKGGSWESAVNSTAGKVMISGGQPVKAYFSSTTGAYIIDKGWDTTDGSGGSNFIDKAYEKLGGSPWLYKAWYRQGYTSSGATCGKNDPWLNNEEFTDIVNAAIVLKSGLDSRVSPITPGCSGENPYSHSELRAKGGVNSVNSVVVTQGNGVTTNVNINGSVNITGLEFKRAFNLRAPGFLKMPQGIDFGSSTDFAFFNIEKK